MWECHADVYIVGACGRRNEAQNESIHVRRRLGLQIWENPNEWREEIIQGNGTHVHWTTVNKETHQTQCMCAKRKYTKERVTMEFQI